MTGPLIHPFDKTIDSVDSFEPLLGKKLSSITIDDTEGITDIGFEGDIHLILKGVVNFHCYNPKSMILPIKIVGAIVHVS